MTASDPLQDGPDWTEAVVTVQGAQGLHARPAIRLSRLARSFASQLRIGVVGQDRWADAKSLAKVMGLRVEAGSTVVLRAAGSDAVAALAALEGLIASDFAEGGGEE